MSGPFFPDNPNREARVKQLITQTTAIQSTFEQTETQIQGLTNIEPVFSALAKAAGYPTTEQYIQAGLASLTDAQKANYQHVCDNLLIHSPHLKNAMIATGIVGAIGTVVRVVRKLQNFIRTTTSEANLIVFDSLDPRSPFLQDGHLSSRRLGSPPRFDPNFQRCVLSVSTSVQLLRISHKQGLVLT